ncbi:Tripartite tricarboxylate transporter family receptor [Pigmentiphaga humi]|uniref:Tripartite tricarboxylate transporter family receptor n=1 Tax=Pigmentiphaga humi TaxID=2478468 RepID=A0A3P4AXP8_9BURK|nr:tripartite tricarboxylate transporter substrate-binding protein [Pigmentiphaga humi]VCU68854.1 Tripartite tricarboxylate transporter family receptor [Pigmentiphaga humi]
MTPSLCFLRRRFLALAAAPLALAVQAQFAFAADGAYPNRPIKIIVPYTPGTSADTFARMLSEPLGQRLGQTVVVENKAGAATAIGTAFVAKAPPDGYTLMMSLNSHVITPASRKSPYDPVKDFDAIGQIVDGQLAVLVHPSNPADTFPQLVEHLRKQGDAASYSSPGTGSTTHLYTLVLQDMLGTKMRHIPANGMNVATMDVMQNNSTMIIGTVENARTLVASGKLKAIAQTGKTPSPSLPGVPSIAQSGYPDFDFSTYLGLYAPAGTPREIILRLNKEVGAVMDTPQMRRSASEKGYDVVLTSPEAFAELTRREFEQWKRVIKDHGLQAD